MNRIQLLVEDGVRRGVFPGACYAVGDDSEILMGFAGSHTYAQGSTIVDRDTIWDLASLTKVVATTSVAAILHREGELSLDRPVAHYVPEFAMNGKANVLIRDLLIHESGLISHRNLWELANDPTEGWRAVLDEPLVYRTGERTEYSCIGFMALYLALASILAPGARTPEERATAFRKFLRNRVWEPLGMQNTDFCPAPIVHHLCAPTEVRRTGFRIGMVQGEVHDENCALLGGVSGNAGLFSTIDDIARWATSLVKQEDLIYTRDQLATWRQSVHARTTRGLGWDTRSATGSSAGVRFSSGTYGHLGFTGTSVWIDPARAVFAVLLSNRVHPTRDNLAIQDFRPEFYNLAHKVMRG